MSGALIRAYGEFWRPELVNWGRRGPGGQGTLIGNHGPTRSQVKVDVWRQRGIYVLLQEWKVVYVGKTAGNDLGARLRTHLLRDELVGRWDRFSWYGTRHVKKDGTLGPLGQIKSVEVGDVIATLEAILIAVTEPSRNRRKEKIPGAVPVVQDDELAGRPSETILAEIHAGMLDVVDRLDRIESAAP